MYFIKCLLNVANFYEHEHELEFQVTFLSFKIIGTYILIIKNIIKKRLYNHAINKFDKKSNYKIKNKNSLSGTLALDL